MRTSLFLSLFGTLLTLSTAVPAQSFGVVEISQKTLQQGDPAIGDLTPGAPITITVPGHYRLSANLSVPSGGAIQINTTSGPVTLDLNGFALKGPGNGCSQTSYSISCPAPNGQHGVALVGGSGERLVLRNGSIEGFGGDAVQCASGCRLEALSLRNNHGYGVNAPDTRIERSRAYGNGLGGFVVAGNGSVISSSAKFNGRRGIAAAVVRDAEIDATLSVAGENAYGLIVSQSGQNVSVTHTIGTGLLISGGSVEHAVVRMGSGTGVELNGGSITDSTVRDNVGGIAVSNGIARDNVLQNNTSFDLLGNPVEGINLCGNTTC